MSRALQTGRVIDSNKSLQNSGGGPTTATLQEVTDNGDTTSNDIHLTNGNLIIDNTGVIQFNNGGDTQFTVLNNSEVTSNRTATLPDADGTIALVETITLQSVVDTDDLIVRELDNGLQYIEFQGLGGSPSGAIVAGSEAAEFASYGQGGDDTVIYSNRGIFPTIGGSGYTLTYPPFSGVIPVIISGSAILDFSNTAGGASSELTIAVAGAEVGDPVSLSIDPIALPTDSSYTAYVSSSNTVTIRFNNYSAGAQDPSSGTFRVCIFKF